MHPMSPPRRHGAPTGGDGIGVTATGPEVQAQGFSESPLEKGILHLPVKPPGLTHMLWGCLSVLPGRHALPRLSHTRELPTPSPPSQAALSYCFNEFLAL